MNPLFSLSPSTYPYPGPRSRRTKKSKSEKKDEKRPRTAFTAEQLARLKQEFQENRYVSSGSNHSVVSLTHESNLFVVLFCFAIQFNRYLTEKRRQDLARDLKLNESQIKVSPETDESLILLPSDLTFFLVVSRSGSRTNVQRSRRLQARGIHWPCI